MPKMLKPYFDWRGGLNTDAAPDNMMDSELAVCENASLSERGGISKRMGTSALNAETYGLPVHQIFEWPRNNGEVWLMAVIGTDLCVVNAAGDKTIVASVKTNKIGYVFFQDCLYFVDGENYRRYDGSSVDDMVPSVPPAPVLTTEGRTDVKRPVGTYEGRITFVTDLGAETDPSPVASVYVKETEIVESHTESQQKLDEYGNPMYDEDDNPIMEDVIVIDSVDYEYDKILWTLPIGPPNTVSRKLYRRDPGEKDFFLIEEIEDNTTETFEDDVVTAEGEAAGLYDIDIIAKCKFLARHTQSNRFFAAGNPDNPTALYYSEPNNPAKWKVTSMLVPTLGEGKVTGLTVFGDSLLVIYQHGMWHWRGIDPEQDVTWKRVPIPLGGISFHTIGMTPSSLTFLGVGGIYAMSPVILGYDATIQPDSGVLRNLTENKVERVINSITKPDLACGIFDPDHNRYMLAYSDDENAVANTKLLIYEWTLGAFHQWTGLAVNDFCYTLDGRLLGAVNGFIIQFNVGYKDYGNKAIEFVVKTKPFNLDYPFHKKRITRLYISFRQPPEQGDDDPTITAKITVDNETQEFIQEKAISENFVWGSEWGRIWGYQELITSRIRVSESGHRVQMEFENKQLNKSCTVYGCAFEFRPIRAKGRRL